MAGERRAAPLFHFEILQILADGEERSLQEIRRRIPEIVKLGEADSARNPKRPNEPKWHSDVSNRLQTRRAGSLVSRGFVEKTRSDGHRITEAGTRELSVWKSMATALEGAIIDDVSAGR